MCHRDLVIVVPLGYNPRQDSRPCDKSKKRKKKGLVAESPYGNRGCIMTHAQTLITTWSLASRLIRQINRRRLVPLIRPAKKQSGLLNKIRQGSFSLFLFFWGQPWTVETFPALRTSAALHQDEATHTHTHTLAHIHTMSQMDFGGLLAYLLTYCTRARTKLGRAHIFPSEACNSYNRAKA